MTEWMTGSGPRRRQRQVSTLGWKQLEQLCSGPQPHLHEADIFCLIEEKLQGAQQLLGLLHAFPKVQRLRRVLAAELGLRLVQDLYCLPQVLIQQLVKLFKLQPHLFLQLAHLLLEREARVGRHMSTE